MKVFFDTNIWISLFIGSETLTDLLEKVRFDHAILTSSFVLLEISIVLKKKFHYSPMEIAAAVHFIKINSTLVEEQKYSIKTACRDKSDEHILFSALSAKADCILTGDQDLLSLRTFENIPILPPYRFWAFEVSQ